MNVHTLLSDPLVSAARVAEHFGVCVGTVNAWVRLRRIPCVRLSRRVVRFRLSEVEAALRQGVGADDVREAVETR